jgi:hypothetical protein
MSAEVILLSALNMRRALVGDDELTVERDGVIWRYVAGEGLTISRGDETVELPEDALDELRWEVVVGELANRPMPGVPR